MLQRGFYEATDRMSQLDGVVGTELRWHVAQDALLPHNVLDQIHHRFVSPHTEDGPVAGDKVNSCVQGHGIAAETNGELEWTRV